MQLVKSQTHQTTARLRHSTRDFSERRMAMVEDNVPSIQETVDRILDGYIQRHVEFEPTVELLRRYFGKLSSDEQKRMFDRLWEKFLHALDKTRKPSKTTGLRPDICPVVI
ncbi:MAG: hypothetical protein ACRD22_20875, partial [Terriglobia bacterium]